MDNISNETIAAFPTTRQEIENATAKSGFRFDDPFQRFLVASAFIIIGVLGLLGNSLVIIAVSFSRKLHTISNVFVVNLSVADLITSANLAGTTAQVMRPLGAQFGKDWLCELTLAVNLSCVGVSIMTLASISLTRAIVVTKPFLAARFSKSLITVWLLVIWLIPVAVTIIPNYIWEEKILGYNYKYGNCLPKNSHPQNDLYNFIAVLVYFPLPFMTIVTSFIVIFINMKRHSRYLVNGNQEKLSSVPASSSSVGAAMHANTTKMQLQRRQVQITKNMMVVVLVFFVCIGVFTLSIVIPKTAPSLPYLSLLMYFNSCVNPFIYAKHPHFREIFAHILKGRLSYVPEKTMFLKRLVNAKTKY